MWRRISVASGRSPVRIDPAAPEGVLLTNFAQILSSEDDASYADNFSKVVTRVTAPCLVITDQPDSAAVCPGSPVTFSVAAMGTGPIGYQWRRNGNPIAGATEPTYSLDAATALDIGAYDVVVTNACGAVTSAKANLTLLDPVDATPLTNLLRSIGANAVFSTQPLGSGPFTFAWAKDGTVLEGQTQSSLVLTNLAVSDSGTYSVTVMGPCGSVTRSAVLTVDECFPAVDVMLVLDRSKSMDGKPYRDARFAASNFVQNLHYHLKDQAGLVSYNSSATLDQKLTNSLARLEQAIAGIPSADGFTSISLGIKTAQQELMSSRHNPDALPIIVLLSDGMPTASDTKEKALAEALQAKNAGTRIFTVGLGNVDHELMRGMASSPADYFYTTNSSELTDLFNAVSTIICRPPTNIVLAGLSNLTLCPGETALFSVTATGCAPFTYQWMKDGQILPGETNSSLVIPNVSEADEAVYSVDVTGECRTETASAVLTVNEFVAVLVPPANQTHCPGDTAVFSVSATGTDLQYQWYRGDEILAGATNSTLTIPDVSAADAGVYRVVIAGTCGSAATNAAELIVNTPVSIVAPLVDQVVCSGSTVVFSTVASGTGPFSYMWFKDGNVLSETGSALTLNNVTAGDAGIYTVVVSGACGSVTNSASLTVNTVVSATPLLGLTNCPGSTAVFSTVASGSGPFSYAWFKDGDALGETGNTLTLSNVTSEDAGVYSVIVSGACGSVTNSASLVVNEATSASPLPSLVLNPGETAVFTATATGTGPFTYVWKKDGNAIVGQTGSSLTLDNVSALDEGIYTVEVAGTCNTVTQSGSLHINVAPTVSILSPTNGTVLVAPATFPVVAHAEDMDGIVTNVVFFSGTNQVGQTSQGNPYTIGLTNLDVGTYTFTAVATDNGGLTATSAPVTVSVIADLPLTLLGSVRFNPQTGLYEQRVRVTNPSINAVQAIRIYVHGLAPSMNVYNPSGVTNGVPYVQSNIPVPRGGHRDFVIEYHVTTSEVPNPTLVAQVVQAVPGGGTSVSGAGVPINRGFMRPDGTFLVEFATETNRTYYIQYTSDLLNWKTVQPAIQGNGTWIQWIDNGQPKTESLPFEADRRFYRVIVLP